MARPTNTEARQQQIAAAMGRLVVARGYDGTSVQAVAAEAGLAPGVIHYHFRSKEEILLRLVDDLVSRRLAVTRERVAAAGDDPWRAVDAFIDAQLAFGPDADPGELARWVVIHAEALKNPAVAERLATGTAAIGDLLGAAIRRGAERGSFRDISIDRATGAILAVIVGNIVLAATARELVPRGSAAGCAREMARGLLAGEKEAS